MRRRIHPALVALTSLALAACASAGGGEAGGAAEGAGVSIEVNNDLVPPSAITVYIAPETGSRRRLGAISPSGVETFSYQPGIANQDFRLVAEVSGGRSHSSNPFVLTGVRSIRWDVSSPTVQGGEE